MRVPLALFASFVLLGSAVVALVAPSGLGAEHETLVVEGKELTECSVPVLICYNVVAGDPSTDILAGETITVTLFAAGEAPHNMNVIEEASSDANHIDTDVSQAIASSSTVDAGQDTTFQFEAPAEGTVLYFWCDIVEHEIAGMWFTATVQAAPTPAGGSQDPAQNNTTGPVTQNETGTGTGTGGGNDTMEPGNETMDSADAASDNATAGNQSTTQAADDGVDEEDAPGVQVVAAIVATLGAAWAARRRNERRV